MVALSKLKPGDVVYDARMQKMGNTTMSRMSVWSVFIKDVHADHVVASWNGNSPRKYYANSIRAWKRTPPKGTYEREMFDARKARAEADPA